MNGGHSGKDISKNRGNPIIALGKLLSQLNNNENIYLNSIDAGTWVTSIPTNAECTITTDVLDLNEIQKLLDRLNTKLRCKHNNDDILIEISQSENQNLAFDNKTTSQIITYIANFPDGQILTKKETSDTILSTNLGTIFFEDDTLVTENSIRSNIPIQLTEQFIERLKKYEQAKGFATIDVYDFPGYMQNQNSDFINYLVNKYKETFKKLPILKEEHFLLECAWFAKKVPGLQYVSIAPNIENAHSPYERVSISSMQRFWEYVKTLTKDLDKDKILKQTEKNKDTKSNSADDELSR